MLFGLERPNSRSPGVRLAVEGERVVVRVFCDAGHLALGLLHDHMPGLSIVAHAARQDLRTDLPSSIHA